MQLSLGRTMVDYQVPGKFAGISDVDECEVRGQPF